MVFFHVWILMGLSYDGPVSFYRLLSFIEKGIIFKLHLVTRNVTDYNKYD